MIVTEFGVVVFFLPFSLFGIACRLSLLCVEAYINNNKYLPWLMISQKISVSDRMV